MQNTACAAGRWVLRGGRARTNYDAASIAEAALADTLDAVRALLHDA